MNGTKSATLLCGALLASVCGAVETASANPTELAITTSINGTFSVASAFHTFGGPATTYGAATYPITVSSGASSAVGFDYAIDFDLIGFDISYFPAGDMFHVAIDVAMDGGKKIGAMEVVNYSGAVIAITDLSGTGTGHTDGSIMFSFDVLSVYPGIGGEGFVINFTTVPAPGALALLGLAGVAGGRRRRG
jgi:MYXO-CTERM domain-containing protein